MKRTEKVSYGLALLLKGVKIGQYPLTASIPVPNADFFTRSRRVFDRRMRFLKSSVLLSSLLHVGAQPPSGLPLILWFWMDTGGFSELSSLFNARDGMEVFVTTVRTTNH